MTSFDSYADFGLRRSLKQVRHAWQNRGQSKQRMALLYQSLCKHEQRMEEKLGGPLIGRRILEIGPGQGLERGRYFALRNEVVGLDLDVIPRGFDLPAYTRMLRRNGLGRLLKTVGRRLLVGRSDDAAWKETVGVDQMPWPEIRYGDICQMVPAEEGFDVVMSWSVFEHLPDPRAALRNVIRTLRPGGIFYISLHLYTSHSGHHDIRAFTGDEERLPLWGHLRPATRHQLHPSSYLNEWRLARWRALFSELAPGADEFLEQYDNPEKYGPRLTPALRAELDAYTDEELFTVDVIYLWQKPDEGAETP